MLYIYFINGPTVLCVRGGGGGGGGAGVVNEMHTSLKINLKCFPNFQRFLFFVFVMLVYFLSKGFKAPWEYFWCSYHHLGLEL